MEQQKLSFIAEGNAKLHSHFGRQFGNFSFYKAKNNITVQFSGRVPKYLYKLVEKACPYKNLHAMFIAVLFIINNWKQRLLVGE